MHHTIAHQYFVTAVSHIFGLVEGFAAIRELMVGCPSCHLRRMCHSSFHPHPKKIKTSLALLGLNQEPCIHEAPDTKPLGYPAPLLHITNYYNCNMHFSTTTCIHSDNNNWSIKQGCLHNAISSHWWVASSIFSFYASSASSQGSPFMQDVWGPEFVVSCIFPLIYILSTSWMHMWSILLFKLLNCTFTHIVTHIYFINSSESVVAFLACEMSVAKITYTKVTTHAPPELTHPA